MKVIILEYVNQLTSRYHSDGGLVIIAKDLERAKEMFPLGEIPSSRWNSDEKDFVRPTEEEWGKAIIYDLKNDNEEERYFVFPDAGCC